MKLSLIYFLITSRSFHPTRGSCPGNYPLSCTFSSTHYPLKYSTVRKNESVHIIIFEEMIQIMEENVEDDCHSASCLPTSPYDKTL